MAFDRKIYFDNYRRKNLDKFAKWSAEWRLRNPEKVRIASLARKDNEKVKERERENYNKRKDHFRKKNENYRKSNPEVFAMHARNRRARAKGSYGRHTTKEIIDLYNSQNGLCKCCGCDLNGTYHVDHILPIKLGGSNDISNLQILCQPCNQLKRDRSPEEWERIRNKYGIYPPPPSSRGD